MSGIPLPPGVRYRLRAEEIKETAFRLDGLLAPEDGTDPLIFLEVQFQPDAAFHARWFAEISLYLYRHRVAWEWRAVVLHPRRAVEMADSPAYTAPAWPTPHCH